MLTIRNDAVLSQDEYVAALKIAESFHGHLCPGMFNGVKMSLAAKKLLGYTAFPDKDLIVIAEIDRCLTDAIMAITGCRLGRRSMKFRDYGKFAATFCSLKHGQGFRLAQKADAFTEIEKIMKEKGINPEDRQKAGLVFFEYPWQKQFSVEVVDVTFAEKDLPGKFKVRETCVVCREPIMDERHIVSNGQIYCKPCLELQNP